VHILIINSGSSSIKFSMFNTGAPGGEPVCRVDGEVAGIGEADAELTVRVGGFEEQTRKVDAGTSEKAIHAVVDALGAGEVPAADAVGYRVVHPGAKLDRHQRITEEVLKDLEAAAVFAPLHDPAAVEMIRAMMKRLPDVAHYACFDTVFHQTMPEEATTYPLPEKYRDEGVRRYGFHGLSCESIVRRVRLETGGFPGRAVIAHLGSGCSVTALVEGQSIDNTMGLTPTGGVVMGTRPGDLDPGLMPYLLRQGSGGVDAVEKMLNHDAGMVALSGMKNDVKAVREAARNGDEKALLALKVFTRSVRKAIGGFAWLLGGLDAVVFAGGIGEHDAATRVEVLSGLEGWGIRLGETADVSGMRRVSGDDSKTAVWVVPAEEDLMIAVHVEGMARAEKGKGER
jgi:acetate kinase